MRRLHSPADLADRSTMIRWAAQALAWGGSAWAHGGAVAVLAPRLNRHDRLVLDGPPGDVDALLEHLAAPHLRPLVTTDLAARLSTPARVVFGWMERGGELAPGPGRWLAESEWDEVEALLREANPNSYVWPREPGPTRWAGLRVDGGLVAVAADAWSAPTAGFLAGVATHPDHRGRGLSTGLCAFVASSLLTRHGTCALMVDAGNADAIAVYRKLGFDYRGVAVLESPRQSTPGSPLETVR
ncbi:ribosomal protein S18 acetylase RimI-like enzyme [Saccharothrix coeruleofusca]|uniref:GNAT family N-acetyltransferase n=1 Tax=Saccharothrix coeruleofusca TaxID=33919 RepID=UPI001AEB5498|nr:GNAT family N-acetyltransferase [Saccharothrix coeruleofusca]MBP2340594.1 ribosomal protein S18 acetylase RimI-like enzyme [Saccharothrix coeruleofusca]